MVNELISEGYEVSETPEAASIINKWYSMEGENTDTLTAEFLSRDLIEMLNAASSEEEIRIVFPRYHQDMMNDINAEASKRTAADISDEIPPASWVNDEPREKSPSAAPSLPQREELKDDPINQNTPPMLYDDSKGAQPSFQTTIDPSNNSVTVKFVKPGENQDQSQQQQPQQDQMINQAIEQAMQPGQQPQGQPQQQQQQQPQQPAFGDIDNGVSY
jgi:hypothetical protein